MGYLDGFGPASKGGAQENDALAAGLKAIYLRVSLVLTIAVAFTLCAAVAPDLVFALGGRVVPESATFLIAVALVWLLIGVVKLTRAPQMTEEGGSQGQDDLSRVARQRLSINVGPREVLTILLPFGLFALSALGLSMVRSPGITLMTTDAGGNVYVVAGDALLVIDPAGSVITETDIARLGISVRNLTELRAADPEHVYLADPRSSTVHEVDTRIRRSTAFDVSAVRPYSSIMALALRDGVPLALGRSSVVSCGSSGLSVLYDDPTLRFPSGLEVDGAGRLVVADSDNSKVLVLTDNQPARIITVRGGFGLERYPTGLRTAPDGTTYTVARKRDPGVPPMYWRGRLGAAGPSDATFRRIPLTWRGRDLDVLELSVLPDGRLLFVPLGFDALMIAGLNGQAEEWAPGDLGPRLRRMAAGSMLVQWGPVLLLVTGIALAMTGFAFSVAQDRGPLPVQAEWPGA